MPLEQNIDQLTDVYIDYLNPAWPPGSDKPFQGDDHIRGIKRVLQNTFPTLNGQVTRKLADLNAGSCPAGMQVLCCSNFLPTGWQQVTGVADTKMLRVVATGSRGGGTPAGAAGGLGGSDDPVLNNKVPSHAHPVPAVNTGGESVGHQHYSDLMSQGADRSLAHNTGGFSTNHQHTYQRPGSTIGGINLAGGGGYTVFIGGLVTDWTSHANADHVHYVAGVDHLHRVAGWTGDRSQAHVHGVPAHTTSANDSASNWVPRFVDSFLIYRVPLE